MKELMSVKERWLAAINMLPIDRLPFWPKLSEAYPQAQHKPFCNMSLSEIHEWIGSDKHDSLSSSIREVYKHCSLE